jgi:glycosyltransferase involved in cell wall biosynthesis
MKKVTIVLPAHNEGKTIYRTIDEIQNELAKDSNFEYEIFVSEDGSRDNTRQEVLKISNKSKIKIILSSETERLGYSKAILRAIRSLNSEIIVFMDADGKYDPAEVRNLLNRLVPHKIVIGYRNPRVDSKLRIIYSSAFAIVFKFLFKIKLKDPSSPFIAAYKKDIEFIADVQPHLAYGFWWEFQARINRKGILFFELPVKHRNRIEGTTQVYTLGRLPTIVKTHLIGLIHLKKEIN